MIVLGVAALGMVVEATVASVLVIGLFMTLTGCVEIVIGLGAREWGRLWLWVGTGLLYAIAGVITIARPGLAVAAFYSFLTAFGEVAFASTFMLSDTKYTFAVGLQTFVSEHDAQRNLMAATAVLIAIPVAAFFYLVQKNLVTGLTAGGTKG